MMLNFKMSLSFNDVVILNIPGNIGTVHGYIHVQLACVYIRYLVYYSYS